MDTDQPSDRRFAPTRWSVVLAVGQEDSAQAREALATLCETYWYPLYAFVRRQGHPPADAQDLTQAFFERILEKGYLAHIRREGGRFRSFLLTALKRFLANEWDRGRAQKRGGHRTVISMDAASAESRYGLEPVDELTAEKVYERQWAQALLDQVMTRLEAEYGERGKAGLFQKLRGTLSGPRETVGYAVLAVELRMTEAAVKMAVQRLRARYRELLRLEIAQTVAGPEEVEEEIRHLRSVFGS